MAKLIDRGQLQDLVAGGAQLVEVLPAREYEEDHLPGARSIPLRDITRESAASLDPYRPVIVYCWDSA
jgi:rhodanese-related sulfurtransferase